MIPPRLTPPPLPGMVPPPLPSETPPPLPIKTPPVLPSQPHSHRRLSPARRWSRILVWAAFAVVATLRILHPPEPMPRGQSLFGQFEPGNRFDPGGRRGWGRRPPTQLHPPMGKVPADLWRISIELTPEAVATLRGYYWGGRRAVVERPEVAATVHEGGLVYTNVTVHLKGSAGSFRPFDDKPALTLNFAKHASGQRFHGFSKISLNNSLQDPSYLAEALSREVFEAADVPVPRANHATVIVNGRDLGLYVATEGWGKPFLRRYFQNVDGNLYDGGFVRDIDDGLDINSGEDGESRAELERLADAASDRDLGARWQRLSAVLDVDRFASLLALEVMLCHWDGYALNRNNYRVFHDRSTGRLIFMPHGMDQLFGEGGRMSPTSALELPMRGKVAQAFLSVPEGRRLYRDRIVQLRAQVFVEDKLTNRVGELSRRIRPTLAAYAPSLATEHDLLVADLCRRIGDRVRSISQQLATPRESIAFGKDGTVRLAGWKTRLDPRGQAPAPRFEREERDGKTLLRIQAAQGGGAGSWRTRVRLTAGQYRFEGQVRTEGIGVNGGVCLRMSGSPGGYTNGHDGEWTPIVFSFRIDQDLAEVELVCEFASAKGEVFFDEGTLRLVRE